jgi:endoglucanase
LNGKILVILTVFILSVFLKGYAFLHTDGQNIVDTNGDSILLRGYGLGGWLVPEGYMLHTPGYGSPTYIDSLIRDLIGNQYADDFWDMYRANYVREIDIQQISNWGCNSIRLPFHYKNFYDPNIGSFLPEGFSRLDTLLSWCAANNLYIILDMHCAPGGQNKDNISDSDGIEARLWTEPTIYQPMTIKIWKEIAQRYSNDPRIGGYDLLNEPVLPQGYSNQILRDFYVQLTDTIRSVDTNHIIFVEGNWYATDFAILAPPWDNNMVYSFHKYWNETTVNTIQYLIDIRSANNTPLWMGESGENSNTWYYETIRILEQNNIGWCWWAHKKFDTITSPFSAVINEGYQIILNYWNGQAPRPSPGFAYASLLQMADNLKIENCEIRPGISRALFDPDFGTNPQSFVPLSIPGIINAVHYDYGKNAVGYVDQDYKNTSGAGGTVWNNGYQYRNDGVDIERSTDPQGYIYNVGWVEGNEWIRYTVNVMIAGEYQVDFRVASDGGGGQISLYLDNQSIGNPILVPNTGGWQNWTTIHTYNLNLPSGSHQLILSFPSGGFNLNRMNFILTSTSIKYDGSSTPITFELFQNYPNPFNSTTVFKYQLPQSTHVILEIYDVNGNKVKTLLSKVQPAGNFEIRWEANDIASGIYFYRIHAGQNIVTRKLILMK